MPRILIIDDSPSMLAAVAMMLASADHQVHSCADGKRAQQMLDDEDFDLILTDIFMPEEDGLEVIRKARRHRPALPIVAMSGYSGPLDMLSVARHMGASQLLRKPFSKTDLLAAVGKALGAPQPCTPAVGGPQSPPFGKTGQHL